MTALRDRTVTLTTPEQVDAFLRQNAKAAVFKIGNCHKTPQAFAVIEAQLAARADVPLGVIRVIECRAASNHVAALAGVEHESPQLVLFREGRPVFDRDNWEITPEAVAEGLSQL